MARILIAEDRDVDRQYLATLLGYYGHRVVQARDGAEALAEAARERPDLVISDVLMPTVDGFEFVRRLRDVPGAAFTPVIFYTASYHEREARRLASRCGVNEVLIKPCEPAVIIAKIDSVLGNPSVAINPHHDAAFDRDHLRVVSDKLLSKVEQLEASEARLTAVVNLSTEFASVRGPHEVLQAVCTAAREVTFAQHAVVGILNEESTAVTVFVSNGIALTTMPPIGPAMLQGVLGPVLTKHAAVRLSNPGGRPEALGMPATHPNITSYLAVPIASATLVYGWIGLRNKLGADAFTEQDEQVAIMIGLHAGTIYENARLVEALQERTAELAAAEARTSFALDAARAAVFEIDVEAGRVSWSDAAAAVFGERADTDSIDDAIDRIHPDDRSTLRRALDTALSAGAAFSVEVRSNAGDRCFDVRGAARDSTALTPRIVGVGIDITGRKSLEAQVRQAQKMELVGQLAGGVAHDFNNLLTVIRGYAEFLSTDVAEPQRKDVEEILVATDRAAALTRQLLAFSRHQRLQRSVIDLNDQVTKIITMLTRLVGEAIEIVFTGASDLAAVRGDAMQIDQVLMNLVVNARDAMPTGGRITIDTANVALLDGEALGGGTVTPGAYVRLTVSDTGTGMSKEVLAHLFEPFFTTKGRGQGTGLGLATLHGIVAQSDGYVRVESSPGRGSTFRVYLPTASGESRSPLVGAAVRPRAGTGRVLIVEDESPVREIAEKILRRAGYSVFSAATPERARAIYTEQEVDLLLTDVVMLGCTGPALYDELMAVKPNLRVLYMSGYADATVAASGAIDFDAGFIQKPFSADLLERKVHEVLGK